MKYKLLYITSILTLLSAIGLIVLVTFWSVYPYKTLVINKEPIEVLTKEIGKGLPLVYRIDFCKYTKLNATVQKAYENSITFPASMVVGGNATGCKVMDVSQVVPYELPSGTYKLKIIFIYKVNPIRDVSVTTYTEPFHITERK